MIGAPAVGARGLSWLVAAALSSAALLAAVTATAGAQSAPAPCPAPEEPLQFAPPAYVDTERAGGEPTVQTHPDGTLLYTAHAGTTHLYAPAAADADSAAFGEHYTGQTYVWRSTDQGRTWTFVPRLLPPAGVAGSGFSDPDLAIDAQGNVYESEINLANVAISRSSDSGKTFTLQNLFGGTLTDREWLAADTEDVVYLDGNVSGGGTFPTEPAGNDGHFLYKSVDGGRTFSHGYDDTVAGAGLGDLRVDPSDGTLYELHLGTTLSIAAFRNIRNVVDIGAPGADLGLETHEIARNVSQQSFWPAFDLDERGNLYITWDESGHGGRPAGIYYSYSTDRGVSWSPPERVDTDDHTAIWPWIAVGDPGRVAIAWFEADVKLPYNDPQTPGTYGWRVSTSQTLNGLGCDSSSVPGFRVTSATPADHPVHSGGICLLGLPCQRRLGDRRMGDYFTIDIDNDGHMWAGYADTFRGGAVALPGIVRQVGGPSFLRKKNQKP